MNKTLARRLETLEERIAPAEEPILMDVVFIDAETKQPTGGFQVKLGPTRPLERRLSRTHHR